MVTGELGRLYKNGEVIVRQGEVGDCMYVIQEGHVEVFQERNGEKTKLAELGRGDIFGEIALFESYIRSATVRALGQARVLTIDKKILFRRVHEDPSLVLRIIEKMAKRIRELSDEITRLKKIS
jgi:CRP-like cAMP-binding protein